ncbi:hypothetical protein PSECIP111854_02064 [Pseudoalteromonas sp. CIP111854]|uniref:Uncharacterized protein n=1 Tax=Pseudoalteromonas holothuriae TaxID=2963714 RepID=A0A9W4QXK3_9GAMM|nr:hypothetical protein [Pseudoalteromonas sp. CIP111854]CAH9057765.1 hypothetical protein PSECIP111854_02064 [Pseudoalteromonas sp. CIP111854]
MFNWSNTKHAIYLHGTYLLTHPESGERWQSKQQAQLWFNEYQAQEQLREDELAQQSSPELKTVKLQSVTGALRVPSDLSSGVVKVTVAEGQNVTLTGQLEIDDESFLLPVLRDDGRRIYFPIEVQGGQFNAIFNFPTSGRFEVSAALLNEDFAAPRFSASNITFYVVREAQAAS